MLDQNTDRMWYVIGAVLVGAAIILIANGTLPQMFASVTESFDNSLYMGTSAINQLGEPNPNILAPNDIQPYGVADSSYSSSTNTWTLELNPNPVSWWSRGLQTKRNRVEVPYGERLTISYDVWIPEGAEGVYAAPDINTRPLVDTVPYWAHSDNDLTSARRYNGYLGDVTETGGRRAHRIYPEPGEWTTIWFTYINKSDKNVDKVSLYDYSYYGIYNNTDNPITIKIRNVKGELGPSPTPYVPYAEGEE